jgi:NhaP-type Na+/H+ or K+/H+ antiporter
MKIVWTIVAFQIIASLVVIGVVIYLIVRRVKIKKKENFEKRDN